MKLVVDASVALKWFFRVQPDEENSDQALQILKSLDSGKIQLFQPPHFLSEVTAVLARKDPDNLAANLADLLALDFQVVSVPQNYAVAASISIRLQHHLFDTLYHAVALNEPGAIFVTADLQYFSKAQSMGQIVLLSSLHLL